MSLKTSLCACAFSQRDVSCTLGIIHGVCHSRNSWNAKDKHQPGAVPILLLLTGCFDNLPLLKQRFLAGFWTHGISYLKCQSNHLATLAAERYGGRRPGRNTPELQSSVKKHPHPPLHHPPLCSSKVVFLWHLILSACPGYLLSALSLFAQV